MSRVAPWRRFEARVDADHTLEPRERARRAKIAYRAFMRRIAKSSAKSRARKKALRDATLKRRLAKAADPKEVEVFAREPDEHTRAVIVWAAAQRGEKGIKGRMLRQLEVRQDCLLCRRPFTDADREGP